MGTGGKLKGGKNGLGCCEEDGLSEDDGAGVGVGMPSKTKKGVGPGVKNGK